MASPQIIVQHLIYDGAMFGVPCDGSRNVEARPVTVPMGAQCVLRLACRNPATFATVMPERAFDAAAWRFELRDRIGAEHTVLFATAEARPDDDHIDIDMSGTLTDELAAALGERTVGEFPAMLSGYDSDKERIVSVVFRLRIGNTTDDEAVPEGADSLYKQVQEARATANDAEKKATEADGKAQDALDGLAGKADLVGGKVPSSQLPSYVDDVVEYASRSAFPATGEAGKIYVALDTNKTYRWSGSEYVQVGGGDPPVQSVNGKTGAVVLDASDVGAATKADATLTTGPQFSAWTCEPPTDEDGNVFSVYWNETYQAWMLRIGESGDALWGPEDYNATTFTVDIGIGTGQESFTVTATRSALPPSYVLGSQSDKPLAPAKDYALKSEIPDVPVKVVKRNGTALVPDAQGAVNVEVPTVPTFPLSVANGGTGATTAAKARENLGAAAEAHSHDRIASPDGNTVVAASGGGEALLSRPAGRDITYTVAEATVTLRWPSTVRDHDISAEIISVTGIPNPTVSGRTILSDGEYWGEFAYWLANGLSGYVPDSFGGCPVFFVRSLSRLELGSAQDETLGVTQSLAVLLDADRNLLPRADVRTSTVALAPQTAVYRAALGSYGTFPTVDATAIPTASAYYCFELELAVPSTVPSAITGPTGWTWLDGGDLPAPSVLSGGETIYVACRLDCATRAVTANVWRVA